MAIRTLIVDDEPLARRGIREHLAQQRDVVIIEECRDGREAVAAIKQHSPDLVFLDVQMPELDGFQVLQAIGAERMPAVIFVTAYDKYALQAFEVHALDYLLKPFNADRFSKAFQRARLQLEQRSISDLSNRLQSFLDDLKPNQKYKERLAIKSAGRIFFLNVAEIDWIEAADNYAALHVAGEEHLLRETMNSLEQQLDPAKFLRIHRSRIINIQRLKELRPLLGGEYEIRLQDGTRLESGRRYRGRLQELFGR